MAFLFNGYVSLLQRHTLLTQMATSGTTSALGDVIYQQAIEKRGWANHQLYRTQRLVFYGAICWAPISNRWHATLNKINVGGKWTSIAARTGIDLAFMAPFATSYFYLCQGIMERRPFWTDASGTQGIKERIDERLFGTVMKQWALFGPAQVVNLSLLPLHARPPFMNFIAIGWNCFLAGAANKGSLAPQVEIGGNKATIRSVGSESAVIVATEVME